MDDKEDELEVKVQGGPAKLFLGTDPVNFQENEDKRLMLETKMNALIEKKELLSCLLLSKLVPTTSVQGGGKVVYKLVGTRLKTISP